jgi:hypothetical protein
MLGMPDWEQDTQNIFIRAVDNAKQRRLRGERAKQRQAIEAEVLQVEAQGGQCGDRVEM